ncbi:MAG: hypothetical protein ACK4UO_05595 [Pseudolabrys sp.]
MFFWETFEVVMHKWPITVRYTVIGFVVALAHLIWRVAERGLTGVTEYDLPYILTMLAIPTLIGYAIGLYRKSRGAT